MSSEWTAGIIRAASLEEHQAVVSEVWDLDFSPLIAGELSSRTVFLATPNMVVYREQWNRPLHLRGALGRGQVAFALPTSRGVPFRLLGRTLEPTVIPWMSDSGELDMVTSERFDNIVMVFDGDFLQGVATQALHPFVSSPLEGNPSAHDCAPDRVTALRQQIEQVLRKAGCSQAETGSTGARFSRIDEVLADSLLDALNPGDDCGPVATGREIATQRYRIFRTCIEYAQSKDFHVSVPELCALTSVSRRTLEYAFREVTGTSPVRYMYLCRLRRVHLELVKARPEEKTVTTVATRWNFFELGRFAGEYRRVFGQLPSETLQQPESQGSSIPVFRQMPAELIASRVSLAGIGQ